MALTRTGLMIVRAWLEDGSSRPLRAHIRLTTDIAAGFERELTLVDVSDVCGEVDAWLREILGDQAAA